MEAKERYKRQSRRERKNRARAMNSMTSPSGAGGCGDRGNDYKPATAKSPMELDRIYTDLYNGSWACKKGVDIPVDDMLREAFIYKGLDEQQTKEFETFQDSIGLVNVLGQALRLERLYGGSAILMGVAGNDDKAKEPLDTSTIDTGDLKFLNVIPRSRITATGFSNNPLDANFGKPETFTIQGVEIHRSRLLIFDGNPIAPNNIASSTVSRRRNDGFGDSVVEGLLDDLTYATGTRQAAFQLINQASVWLLEVDMLALGETKGGNKELDALERMSEQISLYRAAMIDNGGDSRAGSALSSVSPSFGSVPELVMTFMQILSAGWDIPATRYLSQAPGGLNATGGADLENYYNGIGSKQRLRLKPQIMKFMSAALPSIFGRDAVNIVDVDVEFKPLWNLSEVEESTVRTNDSNSLVGMVTAGIISTTEAESEARERGILIAKKEPEFLDDDGAAPDLDKALEDLAAGGSQV